MLFMDIKKAQMHTLCHLANTMTNVLFLRTKSKLQDNITTYIHVLIYL